MYLAVSSAGRRRLVRLADLREIVPLMSLSSLDGLGGRCRGVMNLRGESIPVFDLSGADADLVASRFILVLRAASDMVGVIVDEVHDVVTVDDDAVSQRPVGGGRTVTVARVGDELVGILVPESVVADVG